jgi:uncharacterized protein with HEPN domain
MRADEILLLDMLLAAREALSFLGAVSLKEFESDRIRQLAVIKSVEIIGEAAAGVSEEFRTAHPEIPWRDIIGTRNRLVYGYFEVNLGRVRKTVLEDLPALISVLVQLVPPEKN